MDFIIVSIIFGISGCSILNQKDPDVIVTTEPMLTKPEEGTVDKVTSAESVNLDYVKYNEFCGDKLKYKENTEILKEKYLNVLDTAAPYNIY